MLDQKLILDHNYLTIKRIGVFKIISFLMVVLLSVIAIVQYNHGHILITTIVLSSIPLVLLNFIFYKIFKNITLSSIILLFIQSFVSIISLLVDGMGKEVSLFWTGSLPIYIFILLGLKKGVIFSIFNIIFLFFVALNSLLLWVPTHFPINVLGQTFVGYIGITFFMALYERIRKEYDARLGMIIKQRDTLLQEVNHRVKNNMQIIISLLRLQSDRCGDEVKDIVAVAENRIRSMLSIHELLYKGDVEAVHTYTYIDKLTQEIIASFSSSNNKILLDITNENLPMNVLVQSGFIINELVTNAIKYAKNPKGLEITITLQVEKKYIVLEVKDNGTKKQESYSPGLGMIFVRTIVEDQFEGHLDIAYDKGTVVKAVFLPEG